MHNLFVITLNKNKNRVYQVSRPISFHGFSRQIEFDKFSFYSLMFVNFLSFVIEEDKNIG